MLRCSRIILIVWMFSSSALCKHYMYGKEAYEEIVDVSLLLILPFFCVGSFTMAKTRDDFFAIDFVNYSKKI